MATCSGAFSGKRGTSWAGRSVRDLIRRRQSTTAASRGTSTRETSRRTGLRRTVRPGKRWEHIFVDAHQSRAFLADLRQRSKQPARSSVQDLMATQAKARPSDQELTAEYNARRSAIQALVAKLNELQSEGDEYAAVIDTLTAAKAKDADRKCFRMIHGVLVERTVKDVLPALETNFSGIREILQSLAAQYKKQEEDFQRWQKTYNIRVVN
ncbi:uncharacterized protein L969DRAFT_43240 [Mixia osmundae IAM 14324]|uniref:Prefoldin subunit 2 n=1 Tax=Mixia osmundae (strain CBS 9802 / IAM 14324 / JCM 22182 / KY 12970) TaxID=764103 RepID=G7DZX6_MIXOS|nr:uncharacterized protein L969DRAFT_43240 [Mixia osmundae IAM 14324]KEI42127.1 hypothetical protein L969DRAFT_43240 [Mixia osmundae IAM 14324]GAA96136.1 hypothetical protein E5Q_02797 [Mixia osmundae IAM 14324]